MSKKFVDMLVDVDGNEEDEEAPKTVTYTGEICTYNGKLQTV